eukprot:gnl/MRDRNA2_/MRDRNA2_92396_c0_seq1.p1 gnl/MRDRNA2_/MRDRNA2_92396_c0~~gnl/MRDRNA2_/MRDRNA2_92396_c0_seq1.p1  ORF type:complete len:310 (+),score=59.68 gnl/MRDRNA2_/MRDRNA2_92396_c0_seq1:378-1307(+)
MQKARQPKLLRSDKLLVVTVDTRGQELHRLRGPPGWDWTVKNIGAGKPWHGYVTKVKLMQDWVATLADDQYVVFVDGGDVMYGGCDLGEMLARFRVLSRLTNAPVIMGAEYNCHEPPTAGCANYPSHGRDEVLNAFHLKAEDLDSWGSGPNWGGGHMALKFLNSGFYMGQVKDLKPLIAEWMALSSLPSSDQGWAAQVLQNRPDLLALDYGSMLVSNLFGVRLNKDDRQLYSFQASEKQWVNDATGKSVCFFHGNGPAKTALDDLPMPGPLTSLQMHENMTSALHAEVHSGHPNLRGRRGKIAQAIIGS